MHVCVYLCHPVWWNGQYAQSSLAACRMMMIVSRKITFVGYRVNYSCCHRTPFLPEWMTDRQNHSYSALDIWQTISGKGMKCACHFKEHNWQHLFPMINLELSSQKLKLKVNFSSQKLKLQNLQLWPCTGWLTNN